MPSTFISKILNNNRSSYLLNSAIGTFSLKRRMCPSCGCKKSHRIASKYIVTHLQRCDRCRLLFRTPTDKNLGQESFYESDYDGGPVTNLPDADTLAEMKNNNFMSFPNSCWHRIDLLEQIGIPAGGRILDYGASWGYATYQWQQRGYQAEGFELSRRRAAFGKEHLGVSIATSPDELKGSFDVVYSCHVIEHIAHLSSMIELSSRVLKPGGLFVAFTPNGSDDFRQTNPSSWFKQWGHVHPLYLDKEFYLHTFANQKLFLASPPYNQLTKWDREESCIGDVSGSELLVIAQR